MDSKELEKILKEKYNCKFISEIDDNSHKYAKTIEVKGKNFRYRYFNIDNDNISEVVDETEFKHLKDEYETNSDILY